MNLFLQGISTSSAMAVTHWVAGMQTGRELSALNMLMPLGGLLLTPVREQNLFKKMESAERLYVLLYVK